MTDYRHEVAVVVNEPSDVVERRLGDVESWVGFLTDVDKITKVAHERYDFEVNSYGHHRVVRVCVRRHPREHSWVWKTLKGAAYNGTVALRPLDGRRSQVTVCVQCWPDGFMPAVNDMLSGSHTGVDRGRLQDALSA